MPKIQQKKSQKKIQQKQIHLLQNKRNAGAAPFCRILLIALALVMLTGCGDDGKLPVEIVLTSDFLPNEVFRMEGRPCMKTEIMTYLVNCENQYSEVFGNQIWDVQLKDQPLKDRYKETILARIAQIKAMNILAEQQYGITLSEDEEQRVSAAGKEYYASLSEGERVFLDCTQDSITALYREFAIADKLYKAITAGVQPEISDDEARTITVKSILFKTYSLDASGNRVAFGPEEKGAQYKNALLCKAKLDEGEEFDTMITMYNEDSKSEYSFRRGVMPKIYEDTAFALGENEISDVIETEYGYHIIKCLSTFNQEETDANKLVIMEDKKQEVFDGIYDSFVSTLTSNLNQPLWDSIEYVPSGLVTTTSFFDIYDKYFIVSTQSN